MTWTQEYLEYVRALDLNVVDDRRAASVLDQLIKGQDLKRLQSIISGRTVVIYGCGPSLENDIIKLQDSGILGRSVSVAIDGAVKAFLSYGLVPHVNVTDLDGDPYAIVKANRFGTATVVRAHSRNIKAMVVVVPKLSGLVYGTTHMEPTGKVYGFGGYTDGDCAIQVVERFGPRLIVLAGMDFGSVIGRYSGRYDPVRKPRHLRMSKEIIEGFARRTKTRIFNVTSGGENIQNTRPITIDKLRHIT